MYHFLIYQSILIYKKSRKKERVATCILTTKTQKRGGEDIYKKILASMYYFHVFDSNQEYTDTRYNSYREPWVGVMRASSGNVTFNRDELEQPLTFIIKTSGNLYWKYAGSASNAKTIEYRIWNNKRQASEWVSVTATTGGTAIPVTAGDRVEFRGDNVTYSTGSSDWNGFDPTGKTSAQFDVFGNIMSLIQKEGFETLDTLTQSHALRNMFIRSNVVDASKLILPATGLTTNCYTVMFKGCTRLTGVPKLPATTLAESCYSNMFQDCTSITTAPDLPAQTLVTGCYSNMFNGCSSLNHIECLATDINASGSLNNWVSGVSATGTFIKAAGMSGWSTGISGIPNGWTVQETGSLTLSVQSISCPASGRTAQVAVTSSSDWSAASDSAWITLSQNTGGTGNTTVNVVVSGGALTNRTGHVTFTSSGISATLTVSQSAGEPKNYLTFNITSPGYINWLSSDSSAAVPIMYSVNNGEWTEITSSSSGAKINGLVAGDTVQVKAPDGVTRGWISTGESSYSTFSGSTAGFNLEGNVMSLLDSENYESMKQITQSFAFTKLFAYCTGLTSAENLDMPATAISASCYREMFQECTSLTTPPLTLPATSLGESCYRNMFAMSGVINGPELPAMNLAVNCYANMFRGCTSLREAPELPADTLVESCYRMMFFSATSLNYIKCLATDISATNATSSWTQSVAASGLFVKSSSISTSTWGTGTSKIPTNWVVMDEGTGDEPDYTIHESTNLVHSEMLRIPDSLGIRQFNEHGDGPYADWVYLDGIFLKGVIDTYVEYNSAAYDLSSLLDYVGHYYGTKIDNSGAIDSRYDNTQLDDKEPGMALFTLYDLTGLQKYKLCLDMLYDNDFSHITKNIDGVFYHKVGSYDRQGWLDGLYMGEPFRAEYAKRFLTGSAQAAVYDDVVYQITKLTEKTYDSTTGLYRHAYDSSAREGETPAQWVDPNSVNGEQAYYAWSRALGWTLMAIVDVLEILPTNHTGRTSLTNLLSGMCQSILTYRDSTTGVWRNVPTEPASAGTVNQNGFEASSSAMFAYAWLKGVRLGYLPASERNNAISIYQSIKSNFFRTETYHGETVLTYSNVCRSGNPGTADGCNTKAKVYANYCDKEFFDNNTHGFAPAIYAALEYERLTNS